MFKNRVRLPVMFTKPQFPMERSIFPLADGSSRVLSVVIRNTYEGKTDHMPEEWHRKLVIAIAHDNVTVENERLMSDVVLDGDYNIDWQDFLDCPVAPAGFTVRVTPFNATNNNCQSCEEATQLNLQDDFTDEIWEEGTTHQFPDVVTDNDSICCRPFTIELVGINELYFSDVSIDANGIVTATVINPCPIINDVLLCIYRVTCPNGQYDDASVYVNITGSDGDFCAPVLDLVSSQSSSTSTNISWDVTLPTPVGWNWTLYLSSDLGTPIASGTVVAPSIDLTGLTAGISYTISVVSDCGGGNLSVPRNLEFELTNFVADSCGNFTVTYIPYADSPPQRISYMNCLGEIINEVLTHAQEFDRCMLITAGSEEPIYFVASSEDITVNYTDLCE